MSGKTDLPVKKELCTGCTACASVCKNKAILMREDEEGFMSPVKEAGLCNECGLCDTVCPVLHPFKNQEANSVFVARSAESGLLERSSSGGIATELSEFTVNFGGVVCGSTSENMFVHHTLVAESESLKKLQGSKYVQSDLGTVYADVDALLAERKVLFIGTPCQVAGLKNYLRGRDENLVTIDIMCHAVPSPGVLKKYLEELKKKYPSAVTVSFRDKANKGNIAYALSLQDREGKALFREGSDNLFIKCFSSNLFIRRSCASCQYTSTDRPGDLTLGDFWKLDEYDGAYNPRQGYSMVICNTEKGRKLFEACAKEKGFLAKELPLSVAVQGQAQMKHPTGVSPFRNAFFKEAQHGGIMEVMKKYLYPVGIMNFHFSSSFGAVLVSYAMEQAILSLGYPCETIDYQQPTRKEPRFDEYRKKFLRLSPGYNTYNKLRDAGGRWSKIVTGSDQIWKIGDTEAFMLGWAHGQKNLIAYGASFGDGRTYEGRLPLEEAKRLLQRFDAISVREEFALDIMRNTFSMEVPRVIDPTFLLEASKYDRIISAYTAPKLSAPYVCGVFLHKNIAKDFNYEASFLSPLRNSHKLVFALKDDDGKKRPVGHWLWYIKNADLVFTDSFHGTVFSIMYHKNFVSVVSPGTENGARIPSLLTLLGISLKHIVNSVTEISAENLPPINWDLVEKNLENERRRGFDFLKSSLALPVKDKAPVKYKQDIEFMPSIIPFQEQLPTWMELSDVVVEKKPSNHNYARYDLQSGEFLYSVRLRGTKGEGFQEYTVGLYDFKNVERIAYANYKIGEDVCLTFRTGNHTSNIALCIYAGTWGNTQGKSLRIDNLCIKRKSIASV